MKDIRDRMVGPIGSVNNRNNGDDDNNDNNEDANDDNDDYNDNNRDDDNRDNNRDDDRDNENDDDRNNGNDKIAEMDSIDLSWMNNLQLYRQIAPEVFARYDRDKDSFGLFTLRTFIDNINNERVKKKDTREEYKIVKKNVKSEALKEIVKDLEQAIFGDDDNDEDLLEAEELDRRLNNLISKKRFESLREYLKESEDFNPQDRVNALRKKLNNLPKTSSDETSDDNNDNDNNDNEDNQISNFVDKVLKKVSKEIVNDDNKDNGDSNIPLKSNQKSRKNITKQLKFSENLLDKQISDVEKTLELSKKDSELSAKSMATTNKMVDEILAKNKAREEYGKKVDEVLEQYYTKEAQRASKEVEKFNKMINNDLHMSGEKSEIINKLIELYSLRQIYYLNKIDNNSKVNEKIDNVSIFSEISKLEKRLRELPKKGSGMFTSQEFAKLLTFLAQLHAGNNSKKLKNNINQLLTIYYRVSI